MDRGGAHWVQAGAKELSCAVGVTDQWEKLALPGRRGWIYHQFWRGSVENSYGVVVDFDVGASPVESKLLRADDLYVFAAVALPVLVGDFDLVEVLVLLLPVLAVSD